MKESIVSWRRMWKEEGIYREGGEGEGRVKW